MRALIDHYLERLDEYESTSAPSVEEIPIELGPRAGGERTGAAYGTFWRKPRALAARIPPTRR